MDNADKICLKGLRFEATHGVYEEEKQCKQPFNVNIEMSVDTRAAAASDDLALSVDYSQVYQRVRQLVEQQSFNLLETLASRIADTVLTEVCVQQVRVEVEKCRASCGEQHFTSAVVIERGRF